MWNICYSCQILMTLNFPDRFLKHNQISNFMKIRSVGTKLFHADGQTDRQKDRQAGGQTWWNSVTFFAILWMCLKTSLLGKVWLALRLTIKHWISLKIQSVGSKKEQGIKKKSQLQFWYRNNCPLYVSVSETFQSGILSKWFENIYCS